MLCFKMIESEDMLLMGLYEKSSIINILIVTFDLDSDAILLGHSIYAEHTERLYRHHWKVKNSSLPAELSSISVQEYSVNPAL